MAVIGDLVRIDPTLAPTGDHLRDLRHLALTQDAFGERNLQVPGMFEAVGAAVDYAV